MLVCSQTVLRQDTALFVLPLPNSRQFTAYSSTIAVAAASPHFESAEIFVTCALPGEDAALCGDDAIARKCLASVSRCFTSRRAIEVADGVSALAPTVGAAACEAAFSVGQFGNARSMCLTAAAAAPALIAAGMPPDDAASLCSRYAGGSFVVTKCRVKSDGHATLAWVAEHKRGAGGGLWLPSRTRACSSAAPWPHSLTAYSVGTTRRGPAGGGEWSGGGKTAAQEEDNLRRRFASGSRMKLERAALSWPAARLQPEIFPWPLAAAAELFLPEALVPADAAVSPAVAPLTVAAATSSLGETHEHHRMLRFEQGTVGVQDMSEGVDDDDEGGGQHCWLRMGAGGASAGVVVADVLRVKHIMSLPDEDICLHVDERCLVAGSQGAVEA